MTAQAGTADVGAAHQAHRDVRTVSAPLFQAPSQQERRIAASAQTAQKPTTGELFVADHHGKFKIAIEAAREAEATTATPGWRATYDGNMKRHRQRVKLLAEGIEANAKRVGAYDTDEDTEKSIKDATKGLGEEREAYASWRDRAVSPYELAALNVEHMKEAIIRDADRRESSTGLTAHGLPAEVKAIVGAWPDAAWDNDLGTVTVQDAPEA